MEALYGRNTTSLWVLMQFFSSFRHFRVRPRIFFRIDAIFTAAPPATASCSRNTSSQYASRAWTAAAPSCCASEEVDVGDRPSFSVDAGDRPSFGDRSSFPVDVGDRPSFPASSGAQALSIVFPTVIAPSWHCSRRERTVSPSFSFSRRSISSAASSSVSSISKQRFFKYRRIGPPISRGLSPPNMSPPNTSSRGLSPPYTSPRGLSPPNTSPQGLSPIYSFLKRRYLADL